MIKRLQVGRRRRREQVKDDERDVVGGNIIQGKGKERAMVKIWEKQKEGGFKEYFNLGNIVKSVCYCWTRVGEGKMSRRFQN